MDREEFLDFAVGVLSNGSPFLQIAEIAKAGRQQGVFTAPEAAGLEGHGVMPDWLARALSHGVPLPPPVSLAPEIVIAGHPHSLAAPAKLLNPTLPAGFSQLRGRSPATKAFAGTQARVLTQNFMRAVFTDGGFVPELSAEQSSWTWRFYADRTPTRLPGRTLLVIVEGSSLPSHWLFDTMPRLVLSKLFGPLDRFDQILTAAKDAPFHQAGFRALGIDQSRVVTRRSIGPVVLCDEFFTITDVRSGFVADNWVYQSVVDCFLHQRQTSVSKRIFISRAKAGRRRILNEEELLPILEQFGFHRVFAEDLSVFEIAAIMRDATHIVAPHGAGLSNVVFCNPGTRVLEIYNSHISTEFWKICSVRGLPYYVLQANHITGVQIREDEAQHMSFRERNGANMILAPVDLQNALEIFTSAL